MTTDHPITPPPELVQQWRDEALNSFPDDENPCPCDIDDARDEHIATQAARWGADMELEEGCWWLRTNKGGCFSSSVEREFLAARRPKPPSLAEQALEAADALEGFKGVDTIRRALKRLQELENDD